MAKKLQMSLDNGNTWAEVVIALPKPRPIFISSVNGEVWNPDPEARKQLEEILKGCTIKFTPLPSD